MNDLDWRVCIILVCCHVCLRQKNRCCLYHLCHNFFDFSGECYPSFQYPMMMMMMMRHRWNQQQFPLPVGRHTETLIESVVCHYSLPRESHPPRYILACCPLFEISDDAVPIFLPRAHIHRVKVATRPTGPHDEVPMRVTLIAECLNYGWICSCRYWLQ